MTGAISSFYGNRLQLVEAGLEQTRKKVEGESEINKKLESWKRGSLSEAFKLKKKKHKCI